MGSHNRRPRFAAPVVCLLPARNVAEHLPGWFDSVGRFADAVVALDDGSTDETADLLALHPLVRVLLRNPTRPDYSGWDDSANRNRLLAAAAPLAPGWIVSIDGDEIVPAEDAEALRLFIDQRAVAGLAYGFPRYRMIDDRQGFDRRDSRAIRLFAYRPGQAFPRDRFHFMPVPTSIPPSRWLVTDIRIQHLGGLTGERRRARRLKYAEADPDRRWERDHDYADSPPGEQRSWASRRPGQPVICEAPWPQWYSGHEELDLDAPVLSVVLIVSEDALERMVALCGAVERHRCAHPVEIFTVALGAEVADDVARLLPRVTVVRVAPWSSPGQSRNVGLRVAQGEYVVFFDELAALEPDGLNRLVRAHDGGRAVVTGAVHNEVRSAAGWASYFDGAVHASFAREPLLRIGGFDEQRGEQVEADARDRLLADGHQAGHTPLVAFGHRTRLRSGGDYLADRFARGRAGRTGPPPGASFLRTLRTGPADSRRALRRVAHLLVAGRAASRIGDASRRIHR